MAALNLLRLAQFRNEKRCYDRAEKTIDAFSAQIGHFASAMPQMLVALDLSLSKPWQIVIAGKREAKETAALLAELSDDGASRIAIDLERASPVDDATIGVLFRALRAARDAGGALAVAAPEPRLRDALATMGVDRVLRVAASRVEALAALGLEPADGW